MAEQGLFEAFGELSRSVTSTSGNGAPMKDTNKFANWFQSEQGQVVMGGLFNSIGSMGAGLAGLPPGGRDTSSLARGAAMATQSYDIAQSRFDSNKFIKYVDGRIAEEEGAAEPDQDKIMTLQMMRRDPQGYIKGSASGENWYERMQAAYGFDKAKKQDAYGVVNKAATDHFNKVLDAKTKKELLEGNQGTLEAQFVSLNAEYVPYWIGDGGALDGIHFGKEGKKKSGKFLWGLFSSGEDKKSTSGSDVATAQKPAPTSLLADVSGDTVNRGDITIGDWAGAFGGRVNERAESNRQAELDTLNRARSEGKRIGPMGVY
jgi:hypothetical protein